MYSLWVRHPHISYNTNLISWCHNYRYIGIVSRYQTLYFLLYLKEGVAIQLFVSLCVKIIINNDHSCYVFDISDSTTLYFFPLR